MREFRRAFLDFEDSGACVIGVSSDSVRSHCRFAEEEGIPFPILSDTDDGVRKRLGVRPVLFGLLPGRETFVIGQDRRIHHVYRSLLGHRKHVRTALEAVRALPASVRF